jgi:hypothetical protein
LNKSDEFPWINDMEETFSLPSHINNEFAA